jgi:hypothetical protein
LLCCFAIWYALVDFSHAFLYIHPIDDEDLTVDDLNAKDDGGDEDEYDDPGFDYDD